MMRKNDTEKKFNNALLGLRTLDNQLQVFYV